MALVRILSLAAASVFSASATLAQDAALPAPYLGEVATRATIPTAFTNATNAFMARSMHHARQTFRNGIQVGFPNWYGQPVAGEVAVPCAATVTASIEYPAGTVRQLLFSHAAVGTIPPGGTLFSDPVEYKIPNGAAFWVREHYSSSCGVPYMPLASSLDAMTIGATTTPDLTMGGAMTPGASVYAAPVAIVAPTTKPSACIVGDSRVFGLFDTINDGTGDHGDLSRFIGPGYAYIQMGISGDTLAGTLTSIAQRKRLFSSCSFLVDEYGINDIDLNASTGATVAGLRTQMAALFTNGPVYGTTAEPYTTSSDNWATTANQTLPATNAQRAAFNTLVRASIPGETNYIDISDAIDPGRTDKWPVTGAAFGYTGDGLHCNVAGCLMIKRSPVWNGLSFGNR